MKTSFPACKQDGTQYTSLDEIMTALVSEPHGSWLAGTNRMWHGGIHLTEVTAPGSLLKPDAAEKVVPLQCIAEGEVVAWRLNNDYIKSTCLGQLVQYSSTFLLVKSTCKPDPAKESSWLEFYSLYMGLAPLSAFKKCKCMKAKTLLSKRKAGNYENSQGAKGVPTVPEKEKEKLAKDSRVIILKETTFKNGPEEQPFGLAQQLDKDGKATGNMFWVTMLPKYMEEDGEEYAHLPAWMHQAAKKGTFNEVVKPDATMKINAGDPVGFLGEDVAPLGGGQTSSSAYAHIEVMTSDSRMPAFLDNPEGVTSGRKFIRIKPGADIYTSFGNIFIKASTVVEKDIHTVLPEDKCHPREVEGKKYYQLSEQTWVISDDVDIFSQYDLKKLGFTAFAQESTPDMAESLTEEWVKSTFETYSEQVVPQRGIKEQQISDFYKGMIDKLDSDNNGELSGQELYEAVHNPALGIRDIAGRLIVKHESEWFGGSGHPKWIKFFETFDPLRKDFAKKWLNDMEWMSQVEPFVSGGAVWHMHPVSFLETLSQLRKKEVIFPLKVKPKNDINGVWERYYWAALLNEKNASQAIFGMSRSAGKRKHAARDLYTEPYSEIVAVSDGIVRSISHYYFGTWQVTLEHTTEDGRHFYIRYGEVDPKSIVVRVGDHLKQGADIAKTGFMIDPATGKYPKIIPGQVVYMLHFEYYPGNSTTPPPNNNSLPPFLRREDLCDPLDLLQEGYRNTFSDGMSDEGARIPINDLSVSNEGKLFIKGWESFRSKAYNDSEGFCTIGYGHLIAQASCENIVLSEEFANGITISKADELFESRLSVFVSELKKSVSVNLYQHEFDALISLLFNMGLMSKAPQLTAKLNNADYTGAATEFLDITNGGNAGLVTRRKKENNLFSKGVYDSSH